MLPTCNRKFPQDFGKGRPCLNYHIKLCSAPCTGKVKFADYNESVEQALAFLKGGSSNSVKDLTKKMEEAAENLEFERAARIRDKISSIKKMGDKQKVVANKVLDEDVIGSFSDGKRPAIRYFALRAAGFLTEKVLFLIRATVTVKPRNLSCATILFVTIYRKILPLTKILTV